MAKQKDGLKALEKIVRKARVAHARMLTQVHNAEIRVRDLGETLRRVEAALAQARDGAAPAPRPATRPVRTVAGVKRTTGKRTAKRGGVKRAAAKRPGTRRTAAKRTAPARAGTRRTTAKRAPATGTPAKRTAKRASARRTTARRTTAPRTTPS